MSTNTKCTSLPDVPPFPAGRCKAPNEVNFSWTISLGQPAKAQTGEVTHSSVTAGVDKSSNT
eukprot:8553474-Karenia_brevis.AAC.1